MKMINKKNSVFAILLLLTSLSYSQGDDLGIWAGLTVKYQLSKKFDAELSGCIRTFNNTSQVEQSFIEGGIKYNLNKNFSFAGSYRLTSNLEDNSKYYFRHKLFLDAQASLPAGRFGFSARARLQRTTKTYIEDEEDLGSQYVGRMKLKAEYKLGFPLKPFIYWEPFVPLFSGSDFEISKHRIAAGTELQITRKSSVEVEYIFQRDYQPHISDIDIISLNYKLKF
jgi:hypothetical protein